MFRLGLMLFSALSFAAVPRVQPIGIRVRIAESVPHFTIRGYDLRIFDAVNQRFQLVAGFDKTGEWEFQCKDGKIRARSRMPRQDTMIEFNGPVSIQSPVGFVNFGEAQYRGELRILHSEALCDVINTVDLEKYLDGLVNSEFSSKWSEESVAAQVVAARTYAYHQILNAKKKSARFDVDATVRDQVYNGSMKEDFHSSRIAAKTRGLVLTTGTDQQPLPIKAFYHSTCGGMTELPEHVWGNPSPGFSRAVVCPYCVQSPKFRWNLELQSADLAKAILQGATREGLPPGWPSDALEILKHGMLLDLRVTRTNDEHRVTQVTSSWGAGKTVVDLPISGPKFRDWIGVNRLRSTSFQLIAHKLGGLNFWYIQGLGNGHGVGMCQYGAKVMGEKGNSMASILKHYYPDAILRKLW